MSVNDQDALDRAIVKLRALFLAIKGADSIADQDEADALEVLAADTLHAFESVQSAIDSGPVVALAA